MVKTASIKRNYIYNLTYQIFAILIPLVTSPYLARILQADGIGAYSYASSITTYFSLIAVLGTSSYASREAARTRDNLDDLSKLFWEITILRFITTFVSLALFFITVYFSGYDMLLYAACSFTILSTAVDSGWYFEGNEKFKVLMIKDFIVKIISLILIFTLVKTKQDLLIYILIQTVGIFLPNLILTGYLLYVNRFVDFKKLKLINHFRETLIYFIPSIATSIYTVLDKTMIGLILKNDYENGYYDLAYKIYMIILTMITSLTTVIGARTSYLIAKGENEEVKDIIYKSFNFLGIISIPAIVGLMVCSDRFVLWYYGNDYAKVGSLIKCFSPLLLIIGTSNILGGAYLTPVGMRKQSAKAIIAGSVTNLIANFFLIPLFGTYGAAIGSIAAEGVITFLYILMSYKFVSFKRAFRKYYRYLLCSIVMGIIVYLVGNNISFGPFATIAQVFIGGLSYLAMLLLIKDEDVLAIINPYINKYLKKGDC